MSQLGFDRDDVMQAMLDGLILAIRRRLRERIIAAISGDIDAAVNEAIRALEPSIQTYLSPEHGRVIVNLIVRHPEPGCGQKNEGGAHAG